MGDALMRTAQSNQSRKFCGDAMTTRSNHPAADKAAVRSWLAAGHRWRGLPEPIRWADMAP